MRKKPPRPRANTVVTFKPRVSDLEKLIRRLAVDSANVRWRSETFETHTESRMEWRDITDKMMFEVLRTGFIKGDIEPGSYPGEWKTKMVKQMKGAREVGVVAIVINLRKLFVKTVEWEDL
ncbi:MAG: hypothetical protein ABIQ51_08180 [Mesorhizobium sp.]